MNDFLERLLSPVARLAMARGLRFSEVAETLRQATYAVARKSAGDGATDSKLSVMTGLQRRDIVRLRAGAEPKQADRPDPLARLVSLWLGDADYAGATLARHGPAPSFDALARSVRRDVHPKSLLDALIAAGTVEEDGDKVVLKAQAYVPMVGSDAQMEWLAGNVGDHLDAAVDNVVEDADFFEQAVAYEGMSGAAIAELDALWRDRLRAALQDVNARALALQDAERGPGRFRAGAYFYAKDAE